MKHPGPGTCLIRAIRHTADTLRLIGGLRLSLAYGLGHLVDAGGGAPPAGVALHHGDDVVDVLAGHQLGDGLQIAIAAAGELDALDGVAVSSTSI